MVASLNSRVRRRSVHGDEVAKRIILSIEFSLLRLLLWKLGLGWHEGTYLILKEGKVHAKFFASRNGIQSFVPRARE